VKNFRKTILEIEMRESTTDSPITYTFEESYAACLEYFNGNEFVAKMFVDKYALRDQNQNLIEKTPADMHRRLAKEFARIEKKKFKKPLTEDEIFAYFDHFWKILPQGSPMYAIGNKNQIVSASNCFAISPPADSYGGICRSDEEIAQISKRRGGAGIDVSSLRPNGMATHNSSRTSTGIVPFSGRFSNTSREVGQDGRRGALMISCSIHHPESVIPWDDETDGKPFDVEINDKGDMGFGQFKVSSKYFNPKKLDFATCKYDRTKVTGANLSLRVTDEFMNAVLRDKDYEQRWPVDADRPQVSRKVSAKKVWEKLIHSAWQSGEPGVLFWDTIIRESLPDCYAKFGFKSVTTNPCITGDTLVYVADGRGHVPIKQLSEDGKDVPVFCYDDHDQIVIRTMRHPRLTGYGVPVYKITLDDGSVMRVTSNHKFRLIDGTYKEAINLKSGDSLKIITKFEASIKDIFPNANSNSQDYFWINNGFSRNHAEHRIIASWSSGRSIEKGEIVHHKDFNAKNNNPNNLQIVWKKDHDLLHSQSMIGDKNPMRRAKHEWSDDKWSDYRNNQSVANSGMNNGNCTGRTTEEIVESAIELTMSLGRRFSTEEWESFASSSNLPQNFSTWRRQTFISVAELSKFAAAYCGVEYINEDPRIVKTLQNLLAQGYIAEIIDHDVVVHRQCEFCGKSFVQNYNHREVSFCSISCANHFSNNRIRTETINATYQSKADINKIKQVEIYNHLKFNKKTNPSLKEWDDACRKANVTSRLNTKHGFRNFTNLQESACFHNHKVVSVELDVNEDVYNGTVDDFHNFFVGGFEGKTKNNKKKWVYLNNLQCGEIPLNPYDSCRLLVLNLFAFVLNPFTKDARMDWQALYETAQIAQRLMDDLIDLEEECINRIIGKIKADPEDDEIKRVELRLWQQILDSCKKGRRSGTGTTALGDTLAALGISYGSNEGVKMTERIYQTIKFGVYRASIDMAKEVGPFPVWDFNLEKDNPFLNRFKDEEVDLENGTVLSGQDLWNDNKKHGRRNIALMTQAPVGSTGSLAKLVNRYGGSQGIEPLFSYEGHTRRKKVNPGDKEARIDFTDANGDHFQNFMIYPSSVRDWMDITGETDVKKSPWFGSAAGEIDWEIRVKLQAAAQKHIDHSISSTINLPEDVSAEEVSKIYETAWKAGCKGVTVYRENCRAGILVKEEKKIGIKKSEAPKRPGSLPCDIFHVKVKGEEYFVVVGLFNDDPYELFAGKNGNISKNAKKGTVTKTARGHYQLTLEDGTIIENISKFIDDIEEALTRSWSTSLRHGVHIKYIVHQIEKTEGDMSNFAKSICRTLKKYIPDDTIVTGEECPQCGGKLVRQEGCCKCVSCSWTKCS